VRQRFSIGLLRICNEIGVTCGCLVQVRHSKGVPRTTVSSYAGIDSRSSGVIIVCILELLPPTMRRGKMGEAQMANSQAKLMYPGLSGFYQNMLPIAETFVRIVVGVMFLMHVSGKFTAGPTAVAGSMAKSGLEPAIFWAYVIMFFESVGGACLIVGLFTRFFAAALAIEMLVALLFVHLPKGYAASTGGYEYVLLIGAACFFIAIRGGGPYSVDHVIGKEL